MTPAVIPDRSPRSTSIADLLTVLGAAGLSLVSDAAGRDLAVTRTALYDPHADLEETQGGVLLAPGLKVTDPAAEQLIARAEIRRFSAVVMKTYGDRPDDLARKADTAGLAMLVVDDQVEWLHLDSLLNNALLTATQVGRSLSALAVGDLFALAGAIADTVGGATAIEDFAQRILAYSSDASQPIDIDRRDGILGRQVPDLPENEAQYRELYRAEGVVRFPAPPPALPRIAVAIRAGNELLGSIWVVDAHEQLGERAESALLGVAPMAALHLLRARSAEAVARQQRSEMVRRVFDGTSDPLQTVEALGLDARGPFAVLAFAPNQTRKQDDEPVLDRLLDLVTVHCETRVGHTGATMIDGTVYVLAAGRRLVSEEAREKLLTDVVAGAAGSLRLDLLGAASRVVTEIEQVADALIDANGVISLLRHHPDLRPAATADRLSNQLTIDGLGRLLTSHPKLVSTMARTLAAHDRSHGTEYRRCVVAYLDALRDVGIAANRLSMHQNTLRYRLRRARELFGLDLSDPDQVLVLWLALRSWSHKADDPAQ